MSSMNGKVLEFFTKIPKLETDRSNWVIFKNQFLYAADVASLKEHIQVDGTGAAPRPVTFPSGSGPLSAAQQEAPDDYTE